jgi:hypothetical protein
MAPPSKAGCDPSGSFARSARARCVDRPHARRQDLKNVFKRFIRYLPDGYKNQPGQIMPASLQKTLKLTAEQKNQLEQLQTGVDSKRGKILTDEQKKQLKAAREGVPGFPSYG